MKERHKGGRSEYVVCLDNSEYEASLERHKYTA